MTSLGLSPEQQRALGLPGPSQNGQVPRLRLLKVLAQPVFVLDDGDQVSEVTAGVVTVMGRDWEKWAAAAFTPAALEALRTEMSNVPSETPREEKE